MILSELKLKFDHLYSTYNRREWVHPDPLEFLYTYAEWKDREVAALIASCLAYGRVAQILKSVASVLDRIGPTPSRFLAKASPQAIERTFKGFKHRFTTDEELISLLKGIKRINSKYGSLYGCFRRGFRDDQENAIPALTFFVDELRAPANGKGNSLLPFPCKGSACKRLNLFLRWMVREDQVDPGGWKVVRTSKLVVPLDTHMHRMCMLLKLTRRKQADLRTALELTHVFRQMRPEDPVRYDFALTRLGIRRDLDPESFLRRAAEGCRGEMA